MQPSYNVGDMNSPRVYVGLRAPMVSAPLFQAVFSQGRLAIWNQSNVVFGAAVNVQLANNTIYFLTMYRVQNPDASRSSGYSWTYVVGLWTGTDPHVDPDNSVLVAQTTYTTNETETAERTTVQPFWGWANSSGGDDRIKSFRFALPK